MIESKKWQPSGGHQCPHTYAPPHFKIGPLELGEFPRKLNCTMFYSRGAQGRALFGVPAGEHGKLN